MLRRPRRRRARRHRDRDQDRQHHALQRPGLGLRRHRQRRRPRIFKMLNDQGGVERPQDQLHLLRRRLQPAQDGRADAPAGRAGRGRLHLQHLGTPTNSAMHALPEPEARCRSCSSPPAPTNGATTSISPGPSGWQPSYRTEAQIYAQVHPGNEKPDAKIAMLYQNDDFGKDYLIGVKDVLGDKYDKHGGQGGLLRDHRSDDRQPGRHAAGLRRRRAGRSRRRRNSPRRRSARSTTSAGSRCTS